MLKHLQAEYNINKFYITENGCSFNDVISNDGKVHDTDRIDYLKNYFIYTHQAISEGINLGGYFIWSFMDNFEWSYGCSMRFGIVYTDFKTQKRILKDSAIWYKSVIKENEVNK